jgi:hypothetical protein
MGARTARTQPAQGDTQINQIAGPIWDTAKPFTEVQTYAELAVINVVGGTGAAAGTAAVTESALGGLL